MKKSNLFMLLIAISVLAFAACSPQTVEVTRIVEGEVVTETITEEVEVTRIVEGEVVTETVVEEVEVTRIVEVATEPDESEAGPATLTLSFWGGDTEVRVMEAMIEACEATTGHTINPIHIQSDYTQQLLTLYAGGSSPDVVMISSGDFRSQRGLFVVQDDIDPSIYAQDYTVRAMTFENTMWAVPFIAKPKASVVNLNVLAAAGVDMPSLTEPMTQEEYADFARALTSGEGDARILGAPDLWFGLVMNWFGGKFFNEDGTQFKINSPEAIAALEYINNAQNVENWAQSRTQRQEQGWAFELFQIDQVATFLDFGVWFLPPLYEADGLEWELIPLPATNWELEVDGLAVSNASEHPMQAQEVVNCFTSDEAQSILGENIGFGVPVTAAGQTAFVNSDPDHNMAAFFVNLENANLPESFCMDPGLWGDWYSNMFADLAVYDGEITMAELPDYLATREAEINELYACKE